MTLSVKVRVMILALEYVRKYEKCVFDGCDVVSNTQEAPEKMFTLFFLQWNPYFQIISIDRTAILSVYFM